MGLVNGDGVNSLSPVVYNTSATKDSAVGTYAVVPSGATNPNYNVTYVAGSLTVGVSTLTVSVQPATKTYGQANPSFDVSYSGFQNGDNASALSGSPLFTTLADAASGVGRYDVLVGGLSSSNYAIKFVPSTLTVTPAALVVTADDKTATYGGNYSLSATYAGLVNGDTAQAELAVDALTVDQVGTYSIVASGVSNANYAVTYVPGTLTVTPAALTVKVDNASKTYGAANPEFSASYSGLVGDDTAVATLGTLADKRSAVGTYAITASGIDNANYKVTYIDGALDVTPAALTVKTVDAARTYGDANPAFSVTYNGFVNGDTASSLTGAPQFTTLANAQSATGTYPVSVSGLGSNNYVVTYVDGTLTGHKATVTVTANDATKVYGSGVPALSASYSGFVNGDNVSSLDSVASLSTLANATSNVGSYAINPVGVSDDNYSVVTIPGTLTVTPASLTVTPNNASKVYGSVNPAFSATYNGFVNGETASVLHGSLTLTTTATNSSKVGSYVISGAGLLSANYDITVGTGILAVTPAALTVKANDSTRSYGAANPTFSATYSGFVNNDTAVTGTPTFTTTATAASNVGTYPIVVSGVSAANYNVLFINGTLIVKKATATGAVVNATKTYGAALPAFKVNYSGLVNGDDATCCPLLHSRRRRASRATSALIR